MAKRNGTRGVIKAANGDTYKGDWKDDLKHGKGTYTIRKTGAVYEGDFCRDKKEGFGVLSVPAKESKKLRKQYAGNWLGGKRHGSGTMFYDDFGNERYEGEWSNGERSGWGRMYYKDHSIYEGEWLEGQRWGTGLLLLENGNRYEGEWKEGNKHGPGRFFYVNKGQVYVGTWVEGTAKCGEFIDITRDDAPDPSQFAIPELKLVDADKVLAEAAAEHMAAAEQS